MFGADVLVNDSAANNTAALQTGANTPAASTTVTLAKSMTNVMDNGAVALSFNFGVLEEWGKTGRAVVEVPKYYRADLGEGLRCLLKDSTGVLLE